MFDKFQPMNNVISRWWLWGGSWRGGIQKVLLLGQNGRQCDHFTVAVHYHVKCVMLLSCYPPDHCLYRLGPAPRCHQCHISHTDAFVISLALHSDQSSFHPRRRKFWNNCWHMLKLLTHLKGDNTSFMFHTQTRNLAWPLVVIISVLADLSTMIWRDEVSSELASHSSIFPRPPQRKVIQSHLYI